MIDDEFKYAVEDHDDGFLHKTPEDAVEELVEEVYTVQFPIKVNEYRRLKVDKGDVEYFLQSSINDIIEKYFWEYEDFKPSPKISQAFTYFTNTLVEEVVPNIYEATGDSIYLNKEDLK